MRLLHLMLMQTKIKGSIIQIIDHAGHLSNMENSGEFNTQLTGFLSINKAYIIWQRKNYKQYAADITSMAEKTKYVHSTWPKS